MVYRPLVQGVSVRAARRTKTPVSALHRLQVQQEAGTPCEKTEVKLLFCFVLFLQKKSQQ